MEEAQEILLNSLRNSGIAIPTGILSIQDLTPELFFAICSQALRIIIGPLVFPDSLSDSMADRFQICTDMASAIKGLGYIGDISFHKLLYPSEDDFYNLVRFLVQKLSESSENGHIIDKQHIDAIPKLNEGSYESTSKNRIDNIHTLAALDINVEGQKEPLPESGIFRGAVHGDEECTSDYEQKLSFEKQFPKARSKLETLRDQETVHIKEVAVKNSEGHLEEEHEFLKTAVEMVFNDQHPVDFYIEQLNSQVDAKKCNLVEFQSQCDASAKTLEQKRKSLEESLYVANPEVQEKYQTLKEVELQIKSTLSEIGKREEELSKFSADLAKQPKVAPRRHYIERITEITKNSRKQDVDIERILKDTRELQLESNSIQERLHRTYVIASETLIREAKKEPVGRKAYRLLTDIHESFEQISEKILATDRLRREIADYEKKLAVMTPRGLDIDKLQADLDVIRKENEYLEQHQQDTRL